MGQWWTDWRFDPWLVMAVGVVAVLYWRGAPNWWPRRWCFWAGLGLLVAALCGPLDSWGHLLLWPHMLQHVVLVLLVAPLLVLGAPGMPVLRGLPRSVRKEFLGPFLRSRALRRAFRALLHPVTAIVLFTVTTWVWHFPALYQLALQDDTWHRVEHGCFLLGAVLFWWQVFEPRPWRSSWNPGKRIALVLAADLQNTLFCAVLAFAGTSIYPDYAATGFGLNIDPYRDQRIAAGIMWLASQLTMLPAALWLLLRAFMPRQSGARPGGAPLRQQRRGPLDLFEVPLLGRLLASRTARRVLRAVVLLLALSIVVDGFFGTPLAPENMAGTLPWTHLRALAIIGLVAIGNLACGLCPFVSARNVLRKLITPGRNWPAALRGKHLAIVLLGVWLVAYEAFDLWDSPIATAWVLVLYFGLALVIDSLFRGSSFCRYVCPLGQYQMAMSLVSPVQVAARSTDICASCTTHECIRGNQGRGIAGCGTGLFIPHKEGPLDCTVCMDCVDACPHSNVSLVVLPRGGNFLNVAPRAGLGNLAARTDIGLLLLAIVMGGFANAAGMTGPVLSWVDRVAQRNGWPVGLVEAIPLLEVIVGPTILLWLVARWSAPAAWREVLVRGALALVPLGAAMWLAHFGFHLATGAFTALPTIQRALIDLANWAGIPGAVSVIGEPQWAASCCGPIPTWVQPAELAVLTLGFLFSAFLGWRTMERSLGAAAGQGPLGRLGGRALPWLLAAVALYGSGVWIVLQPMQMRGMIMP